MVRPNPWAPVLVVLAAAAASAQSLPVRIALGGGFTSPVGSAAVTDSWNGGWALSAGLHYRTLDRVGVWLEAGYYRHLFDSDAFESTLRAQFPTVHVNGNDLAVVPLTAGAEVALTGWGNTRPYATAGLGYYHVSVTTPSASGTAADFVRFPDPSDDAFGARAGLGVRTLVTPSATLFLDATYHAAWTRPESIAFVALRSGLRF